MKNSDCFIGFLWAPAEHLWDEILLEINKSYPVENYWSFDFSSNPHELSNCIIDIYKTDDIDINKVKDIKLKSMEGFSEKFLLFYIKIEDPKYRKKAPYDSNISTVVEKIKKQIRHKYKSQVKNYLHDIIIHLSDNNQQSVEIESSLKKYFNFKKDPYINLKSLFKNGFINGNFDRIDILVRHHTIKKYMADPNYDFGLYKKMQRNRSRAFTEQQYVERFKKLIYSFERLGYDKNYPIELSLSSEMIGSSHRLSLSYYHNYTFVPVEYVSDERGPEFNFNAAISRRVSFNMKWFERVFTPDEVSIFKQEERELIYYLNENSTY